jgi:hypothetical protein
MQMNVRGKRFPKPFLQAEASPRNPISRSGDIGIAGKCICMPEARYKPETIRFRAPKPERIQIYCFAFWKKTKDKRLPKEKGESLY